jgi:single-stranded DNA-binding protein
MEGITAAFEGRLRADPERRFLPNGGELLHLSVAVTDHRATTSQQTEWVRVSVFLDDLPPAVVERLGEGIEVYAEGKLQVGRWTAEDGTPRSGLRLNAWQVVPLGQIGRRGLDSPRQEPERE